VRALVTGAAGFVGSHLAERLAGEGHEVRAVDCVSSFSDTSQKLANLATLGDLLGCEVVRADLLDFDLETLLAGVDTVFHQAGQPGVRSSWGRGLGSYVENNVLATHRLLEAVRWSRGVRRFVYASSSSVYGNTATYPTSEDELPRPHSPYGVTKLAAEHLCGVYARNFDVPTVSLRYFSVYGPRQRPDMAFHRLIEAALSSRPFPLFGDGLQVRDFTSVDDVVEANLLAASRPVPPGSVCNIAGGSSTSLLNVVDLVEELVGSPIELERRESQPGDVGRTEGAIHQAAELLGWRPRVMLREGLARQVSWHIARRVSAGSTQ